MGHSLFSITVLLLSQLTFSANAIGYDIPTLVSCEDGRNCPTGTTCCHGGCAPENNAQCCDGEPSMFCPEGYVCHDVKGCILANENHAKNLAPTTAQMHLCYPDPKVLTNVYGLPVLDFDSNEKPGLLPYVSSEGIDIFNDPNLVMEHVKTVVMIVHGFRINHDADSYLCAIMAMNSALGLPKQDKSTLYVSPWLLRDRDEIREGFWANGNIKEEDGQILRWDEGRSWYTGNMGTRRDGGRRANSFAALDAFVGQFFDRNKFPNLELVTFTGDCFGADLLFRWGLLSPHAAWEDDDESPHLRVMGMGATSYVYLSERRKPEDKILEPHEILPTCPPYKEWPFGLGGEGSHSEIAERYARRDVVYMVGDLDSESIFAYQDDPKMPPICMDALQGYNRIDRLERYHESLTEVVGEEKEQVHRVVIEPGFAHDGLRMMQTKNSLEIVFGSPRAGTMVGNECSTNCSLDECTTI